MDNVKKLIMFMYQRHELLNLKSFFWGGGFNEFVGI
jgi:hypothetical protein